MRPEVTSFTNLSVGEISLFGSSFKSNNTWQMYMRFVLTSDAPLSSLPEPAVSIGPPNSIMCDGLFSAVTSAIISLESNF